MDSSEDIEKVSTQEQRSSFKDKLDEAQEWLYMDGEDASADEFEKHLDSLKTTGGEIFFRLKELSARPVAGKYIREYLDGLHKTLGEWEKTKPWIAPSYKNEILDDVHKIKKWLDENEAKQATTPGYMVPIFTSDEVYGKVGKLQEKVLKISNIPRPKPKVEKPPKNDSVKADNQDDGRSTSSNSTDNEAAGETTREPSESGGHSQGEKIHEPSESEGHSEGSNGEQDANEEPFDEL